MNPILYNNKQIHLIEVFGYKVIDRFRNEELEIRDEIDEKQVIELIMIYKSRGKYSKRVKHGVKLYLLFLKTRYPNLKGINKWTCNEYVDIHIDILTGYVKYPKQLFHEYLQWGRENTDESKQIRDKLSEIEDTVRMRRQSKK